jgi:hypothetical protein
MLGNSAMPNFYRNGKLGEMIKKWGLNKSKREIQGVKTHGAHFYILEEEMGDDYHHVG